MDKTDDLPRFTTWSSCTQFIFQSSSLLLIFLLHTYAKEDVSVSRDSPRLTALIQMFPLYFSLEKKYSRNSERLIPSMRNMGAQITFNNFFFSLQLSPTTYFVKLFNQSCHSMVSVILKILVSCFTETKQNVHRFFNSLSAKRTFKKEIF